MRVYLLYISIVVLFVVGFRSWYLPFCGLIVLSAFMQRSDMPTNILEIPGMNPWNLLLGIVLMHWFLQRLSEGRRWDLKGWPLAVISAYLFMIVVGFLRAAFDVDSFAPEVDSDGLSSQFSMLGLFVDELVNPIRYLIPGFLVYDGCRTAKRMKWTIGSMILMGLCYAVFVVKYVSLGTLLGTEPLLQGRNRIDREIGLHANDMAYVMVFIFWCIIAAWPLIRGALMKLAGAASLAVTLLATGLCQSRAGFLSFVVVGLVVAALRKPLLLVPLVAGVCIAPVVAPGIAQRIGTGLSQEAASGVEERNWDEITAGRLTNLWPVAIEYIKQSPIVGYGRYAMLRHGKLYDDILNAEGSVPSHPHNAYLEVLLDYGALGLFIVLVLFSGALYISYTQMRYPHDVLVRVVGAVAFIAALENLVIGMSSRALLPRPSAMAMWCAFALSLRLWVQMRSAVSARRPRPVALSVAPAVPTAVVTRGWRA